MSPMFFSFGRCHSANLSGKPSPTKASHVLDDMRGRIACVIDGGECEHGVESTVLDALATPTPLVLRPGSVTLEQLRDILPNVENFDKSKHGTVKTITQRTASHFAKTRCS